MHSAGIEVDQTVQLSLDLGVRGPETSGDEVDDQPCKAPIRYPAPYRTELAQDAVAPLKIRELSGRVGRWGSSAHKRGSSSIHRPFMPPRSSSAAGSRRDHMIPRARRSPG